MTLRLAAEALVVRAAAVGLRGRTLTPEERQLLVTKLPIYPVWLLDLLTTVPICGLELGWRASEPEPDWDGVLTIEVCNAAGILSESLELYPGCEILAAGYVNFGGGCGSGDPYFLCIHDGEDPPLYEVDHDVGSDAETILAEGRNLVAPSLSEFFRVAILTGEGNDP